MTNLTKWQTQILMKILIKIYGNNGFPQKQLVESMTSNSDDVIQGGLQLLAHAESLRSFRDAHVWIGDARHAANRVEGVIATIDQHVAQVEAQANTAMVAHRKKSFLRRVFSKPDGSAERAKSRELALLRKSQSKQLVGDLLSMCASLPTSSAQQKSEIKELRLKKKGTQPDESRYWRGD